jgi:hypothetical protein
MSAVYSRSSSSLTMPEQDLVAWYQLPDLASIPGPYEYPAQDECVYSDSANRRNSVAETGSIRINPRELSTIRANQQ